MGIPVQRQSLTFGFIFTSFLFILFFLFCFVAFIIAIIPATSFFLLRFGFWKIVRLFYPYEIYMKGDWLENKENVEYLATNFKPWKYMIEREEMPTHTNSRDLFFNVHYFTIGYHFRFHKEEDAVLFRMSIL